ncbi:MAG: hypothetical protein JJ964_10860, partial [Rhizobiales bacterium]|nr:hypothetical protein [Hyphomicrobiales bacterium]
GDYYEAGLFATKYYAQLGGGELFGLAGAKVGSPSGWVGSLAFGVGFGIAGALGSEKLAEYLYKKNPAYFISVFLDGEKLSTDYFNGYVYSGDVDGQPGTWTLLPDNILV